MNSDDPSRAADSDSDSALLRGYAETGSETAFAEIVNRHVVLVYSAAIRQLNGDVHRAQDVTQTVFIELARQAAKLRRHPALVGWLYTTTQHVVRRELRGAQRRLNREQEAHHMQELNRVAGPDWREVRVVLDDAMQTLRESDRLAVLLRFFEGQNLRAVGTALGVSEDAARMRVDRALDQLRVALGRRGIEITTAALAPALGVLAAEAAPAGLAGHIVAGSLAATLTSGVAGAAAAAGSSASTQSASLFATWQSHFIAMKAPLIATSLTAALAAVPLAIQQSQIIDRRAELARLERSTHGVETLRAEHASLGQLAAVADEIGRLRREAAELERLRKEKADILSALNNPLHAQLAQVEDVRKAAQANLELATARVRFDENHREVVSTMKRLALAARIYANDHDNQWPGAFEEFGREVADIFQSDQENGSAESLARFEFYPHPRRLRASDESHLFLIREKEPRAKPDGGWQRAYGMVDGSVQTLGSPTADFTEVERKARGIASP